MAVIKKENKHLYFDRPQKIGFKYFIKYLISLTERIYYRIAYSLAKPKKSNQKKYYVSICAIFKDEADYLKEWIEFHRIIGVEHFYLYNNNSSDNYLQILNKYINEGIVTLVDWPKPQSQMEAYKDFITNKSFETQWVGFIDLDEYIVLNDYDSLSSFLTKFKNRPSVLIYWRQFGSSGFISRDMHNPLIEDFTVCWPKFVDIGKFFFNTNYEYTPQYKRNNYMHYMWARSKRIHLPPVNVFGKVCTRGFNPIKSGKMPVQINHYLLKSYQEYISKKSKRGGGVNPVGVHSMKYFFIHEEKCTGADYSAFKYLIELKLKLQENNNK